MAGQPNPYSTASIKAIINHPLTRVVMFLLLSANIAAGFLISRGLLLLDADNLLVRYPLTVILCYLLFFLLIRIWATVIITQLEKAQEGSPEVVENDITSQTTTQTSNGYVYHNVYISHGSTPLASSHPSGKSSRSSGKWNFDFDKDAGVAIIFILLLLAITGAGIYLIVQAPVILNTVVLQILISSGVIHAIRRQQRFGWIGSLFRSTFIPFLIILSITFVLAVVVKNTCPQATTFHDIFSPVCNH